MSDSVERLRLEINWVQSAGGALGAVSSAVLLSTFGVAGTLIGAAIGSLVITVGGAIYSYSIRATRQGVAMAQTVAVARIGLAQAVLEDEPTEADERLNWRSVLRGLPWKRIAAGATAIFVAAMLVILAFELVTGRAVSSYTGGSDPDRRTSIPGIDGGGDSAPEQPVEQQPGAPADEEDVLPPEDEPDEAEPTVEPTEPVPSEPVAPEPAPEPTEVPTTETSPAP